ncbi:MAG TPA: siderophore-interacting protein [Pseudolysinimonas sp.]|nr:siderophore-interacting protein [Pseudolysinimonas sp.]
MLTYIAEDIERDARPAYRPFRVTVGRVNRLSTVFTRVTFRADELQFFGTDALDQRLKLIFPIGDPELDAPARAIFDDPQVSAEGTWYERLRELPDEVRPPFRTYTVRAIRPIERELDIDFVVHDHAPGEAPGPAAAWLADAKAGHELVIVGPDARSIHSAAGIDWHPGDAREVLLAGDETAAPAIAGILEALPEGVTPRAFIELPDAAAAPPLIRNSELVTWLTRGNAAVGTTLEPAVRAWVSEHPDVIAPALAVAPVSAETRAALDAVNVDSELIWDAPAGDDRGESAGFYAWIAGESAAIKSLRRFLVSETGIDRHSVAFMGYWRAGQAERQG